MVELGMKEVTDLKRNNSPMVTPQALAWDGEELWMSSRDLGTLCRILPPVVLAAHQRERVALTTCNVFRYDLVRRGNIEGNRFPLSSASRFPMFCHIGSRQKLSPASGHRSRITFVAGKASSQDDCEGELFSTS